MGTIGGLQTFGPLEVFIGPVVIALGVAVGRDWLHRRPSADSVQHLL
jgi:predicted PurR-regulated permease PerM